MELLFVYVKKYQGLKDVQFNFSPQFVFSYLKDSGEITCVENDCWDINFWGNNSNIKNISGVIGQNGTGKTSLMRLILTSCIYEGISDAPENMIIIYRDNFNVKKVKCYHPASILVVKLPIFATKSKSPRFDKNTLIFHSNHFDAYDYRLDIAKSELAGMKNLSTAFLLQKDKETYLNRPMESVKFNYSLTLSLHRAMEMRRHVDFIRKYHKEDSLSWLKIPKYLRILPNKEEENWVNLHSSEFYSVSSVISTAFSELSKRVPAKNILYFIFFKASVYNLFNHVIASTGSSYFRVNEESINLMNEELNKMDDANENSIFDFFQSLSRKNVLGHVIHKNQKDLLGLFSIFKEAKVSIDKSCYIIDLTKRSISKFNSFFNGFFSEERITSFVDFELSHEEYTQTTPSSGELAMLNLFSRFTSIRKSELRNNLTILLDEIELALHPNWQKKFLNSIIMFFQKEFANRNIQIIISSHSPFIVSDLPVECLNFLNGRINSVEQTFCANIHSLFSDAFFLNDGLVGEFAKQKVSSLIIYLEAKDKGKSDIFSETTSRQLIDLIGEPILKEHLQSMWNREFLPELESRSKQDMVNEIEQLKLEIAKMRENGNSSDKNAN